MIILTGYKYIERRQKLIGTSLFLYENRVGWTLVFSIGKIQVVRGLVCGVIIKKQPYLSIFCTSD
jgi:hypothetical protein